MLKFHQVQIIKTSALPWLIAGLFFYLSSYVSADEQLYTVKQGDTLWSISEKWLHNAQDWEKLKILNRIEDPLKLIPNSQIRIPSLLLKKGGNLAVVEHVQGMVSINNSAGQPRDVAPGMELFVGDEIKTNDASSIRIAYKDGSSSLIQENSQLKIERIEFLNQKRDIQLNLLQGGINSNVKKRKSKGSRFEITSPSAIASVRGTSFRVVNDPLTQLFRTEVLDGSVAVSSQGKEQIVKKGFGTIVKAGKPPSAPAKLLSAIDLSSLPKLFRKKPIFFSFNPLVDAVGYRVEISRGKTFKQQIFGQDINESNISPQGLDNGKYIMRLFAYDVNGLGGEVTYHNFEVKIDGNIPPPELPKLIFPDNQVLLEEKNFTFHWSESKRANAYHFQLANDENFSQLLIDIYPYNFTQLSISDRLPSGKYYWHVAALDKDNKAQSFTGPRFFRILPHVPFLTIAQYVEDEILFSWSKGKDLLNYRIQISTTDDFSALVLDERVSSAMYQLELKNLGDYYIRIFSVDTDGFLSESSNVRHIRLSKQGFFSRKLDNVDSATELSEF